MSQPKDNLPRLLTSSEVCARLAICQRQLRRLISTGSIPFVNVGVGAERQIDFRIVRLSRRNILRTKKAPPGRSRTGQVSGRARMTRRAREQSSVR